MPRPVLPWSPSVSLASLTTPAVLLFALLAGPPPLGQNAPAGGNEARAKAFVDLLASGAFDQAAAEFTPQMTAGLSAQRLGAVWNGLVTQAGAFRRQSGVSSSTRGALASVTVTCEFADATIDVQVTYDADARVAGLSFRPGAASVVYSPPAYADAAAFTEREVTVGTGRWTLPGTLTLPVGAGPFPAVVLVHGSGPSDRDETVGQNKPFKDLALGLASHGISVLRYEKRTRQYQGRLNDVANFTVKDETIDDALAAVDLLRQDPHVDPTRVFVLGHSLGGMLAPRIGAADPRIAGLIIMAGAVRPLEQAIQDQSHYLAMADGTITAEEQAQLDRLAEMVNRIRHLTPADAADRTLIFGAPASVLARSARLRSAGGRGAALPADARAPGRARLPGDDGRIREVARGAGVEAQREAPVIPGAQPPVRAGHREEPARRVSDARSRERGGRSRDRGVDWHNPLTTFRCVLETHFVYDDALAGSVVVARCDQDSNASRVISASLISMSTESTTAHRDQRRSC